jgi:hypothetical protein
MHTTGMPMYMALQLISSYIYESKGIMIGIHPPRTPREIELFEQMITYPLAHFNIQL